MKFIKLLVCTLFVSMQALATNQEEPMTTLDSLTKYKWVFIDDEGTEKNSDTFMIFEQTTVTDIDVWLDGSDDIDKKTSLYYLSSVYVESFDNTKVGKIKNGRAIIQQTEGTQCINYFIYKLTNDTLILVNMMSPNVISQWKAQPKDK